MKPRRLLALGLLNAALYGLLTPLWEGFDEPYHYGVVQQLSREFRLPHYGPDTLRSEVARSLALVPAAHAVNLNHGGALTTFDQWFRLADDERRARLAALDVVPREGPGEGRNYESQQAPLAYLLLAPFDAALARVPLRARIAALRLLYAGLVVLLLGWAAALLARSLGLDETQHAWALLCLFQSQMLYATVAHLANDGLAVACAALLAACAVRYAQAPAARAALLLGLASTALLLTKGYGLAFLPPLLWLCRRHALPFLGPVLALAGPWYARNILLYGTLSGMFTDARLSPADTLRAAWRLPWADTLVRQARYCLFTGNNSYTSFHQATIELGLLLLAAAAGFVLWRARRREERVLLALFAFFAAGWLWSLLQAWEHAQEGGVPLSPWYGQCLLAPFLLLAARHIPRPLTLALALFYTYLMAASWWLKLLPLYAGFPGGRSTPAALWSWASASAARALSQTALAPAAVLLGLAAFSTAAGAAFAILLANAARIRRSQDP